MKTTTKNLWGFFHDDPSDSLILEDLLIFRARRLGVAASRGTQWVNEGFSVGRWMASSLCNAGPQCYAGGSWGYCLLFSPILSESLE